MKDIINKLEVKSYALQSIKRQKFGRERSLKGSLINLITADKDKFNVAMRTFKIYQDPSSIVYAKATYQAVIPDDLKQLKDLSQNQEVAFKVLDDYLDFESKSPLDVHKVVVQTVEIYNPATDYEEYQEEESINVLFLSVYYVVDPDDLDEEE